MKSGAKREPPVHVVLVTVQLLPWVRAMKCDKQSIGLGSSQQMSNWAWSAHSSVGS